MDGSADMTTLGYGNLQTSDWLADVLNLWERQGAPRAEDFTVTAYPIGERFVPPAGASVVALPHWQLVFVAGET